MGENKIKSGKEVLDDFFKTLSQVDGVDKSIAEALADLYIQGKLTDSNVKNTLLKLRENNVNKTQ